MAKVTFYKNTYPYTGTTDAEHLSRRWITRKGAEENPLIIIIEGTGVEIDETELVPGQQYTPLDFEPKKD